TAIGGGGVLTEEQLAQYETDGFTVVDGVFTDEECDRIVEHHERATFVLDLGRPEDGQMTYRPMLHLADDALVDVVCDERWADLVLPLLGPDVRLYWEQAVAKDPGTGTELPWHQDNG